MIYQLEMQHRPMQRIAPTAWRLGFRIWSPIVDYPTRNEAEAAKARLIVGGISPARLRISRRNGDRPLSHPPISQRPLQAHVRP